MVNKYDCIIPQTCNLFAIYSDNFSIFLIEYYLYKLDMPLPSVKSGILIIEPESESQHQMVGINGNPVNYIRYGGMSCILTLSSVPISGRRF